MTARVSPPGSLIAAVSAAVDATVGCGIRFSVFPPVVINAAIVMTLTTQAGTTMRPQYPRWSAALTAYVNGLPVGSSLAYLKLAQLAFNATPAVVGVTPYTLSGGTSDLAAGSDQVVRVSSMAVT